MKKSIINGVCRKFGFEIHGTGYLQAIKKQSFRDDAFGKQKELISTDNPIVFDIGANRGDIVAKYLDIFQKPKIYAFEPFPPSFESLRDRFNDNSKVSSYQVAVGSTNNPQTLYINHNVDTNSLLKSSITGLSSDIQVKTETSIMVDTITIDAFCKENNVPFIDILKMDIQGGEFSALKGAIGMLSSKKVKVIYSEVYFVEQYQAHPLFHEISRFLYDYGFRLQDLYSPIYGNNHIAWADAIFTINA